MLAHPIATVAILLLSSQNAVAAKKTPSKTDFLREMNAHSTIRRKLSSSDLKKEFNAELYGSTKSSAALRKKVMDRSTIIKVPGGDESNADPELKAKANDNRRKLEQNYNKYNNYKDGTDDYVHASGGYENIFGFDPTQFSVSYHRCASVKQFDDVLAATEDSTTVFAEKHFAVFRFCPEQTCQGWQVDYEKCGCEKQCNKASAPSRHSTHRNMAVMIGAPVRLVVRAATHVNPKATKGHTKTRPKKHRASDRNRKKVEYPEIKAEEVPPLMTIVSEK